MTTVLQTLIPEEVDVYPIYRDPIHDFGFLRFDPSKIKYMTIHEIPLAPHLAKVGLDIRVVGNDAGEKLSILAGSISRLDRNAPEYEEMTYNDFNTFYLQAASSTSGGSSGSPVLDINGNAVALQAGGHTKAATDFFFPLDRVKRALDYLRKDLHVPRGTLQAQFYHRPFDEVRRLGLMPETEAALRAHDPKEIGILVVETVLPNGPAFGHLEEGDMIIKVNGNFITKFVPLEDTLDSKYTLNLIQSIGKSIRINVERGGNPMEFDIKVQDLHSITPDRYVSVGGAKLNDLSYQLARQYCLPVEGVYVAEPGTDYLIEAGMFRLDGPDNKYIIKSIDTKPTPNLDAFIEAMKSLPDGKRFPVTFHHITDYHALFVSVVTNDRHWSSFSVARRNGTFWLTIDKTGLWDFEDCGAPVEPELPAPLSTTFPSLDESMGVGALLFQSIVRVSFYMPIRLDGFPKSRKQGAGLVVDATNGIVVVGKNIVPFSMGDLFVTVADSIIIPAKIEYIHPTHNIVFIRYDPRLIGKTPVKSAPFAKDPNLVQGMKVSLVALNHNHRPVCVETIVTDTTAVTIPLSGTPRFRAINLEAVTLDTPLAQHCTSGVLADSKGLIHGLWLSFLGERTESGHDNEYHLGINVNIIFSILSSLQNKKTPQLRGLRVEFSSVPISQARHMGLSPERVREIEEKNTRLRQLHMVSRKEIVPEAMEQDHLQGLKELDVVLKVGQKLIGRIQDLDVSENWGEVVEMTVLRNKKEVEIKVPTFPLDGDGTSRVLSWAGAIIHEPHSAVLLQSKHLPSLIYISARSKGSPAYQYGLTPTHWITHINGVKVYTLDDFLSIVRTLPDNQYVRVKIMSFDMVPCVLSVKVNFHYWPTVELIKDKNELCGWKKILYYRE